MALAAVAGIMSGRPPISMVKCRLLLSEPRPCLLAAAHRWVVGALTTPQLSQQGRHAGLQLPRLGGAMDLPADRSTPTSAPPIHPTLRKAVRSPRRRRPTGAAPPLPYRLQTSGIGWLVAAVILVGLTLAIFARGLRGPAVTATVIDDAVVRWLAELVGPGVA